MLTSNQKSRIEECYNAKNWLCIAFWVMTLGKLVLEYIKELKRKKNGNK